MTDKKCIKCKLVKPTTEFYNQRAKKDGKNSSCRLCCRAEYKTKYKDPINLLNKKTKDHERYLANKDIMLARTKAWAIAHPDKIRIIQNRYIENNQEKIKELNKAYYEANKPIMKERMRIWRENNPKRYLENCKRWVNRAYNNDKNYRLASKIRTRMTHAFRNWQEKGNHVVSRIGDIEFSSIFAHMGPCPGEYGRGPGLWTIDHIINLRRLDLTDPVNYSIAVDYENHQWLRWEDNYKKGNEIGSDEMELYCTIRNRLYPDYDIGGDDE